MEDDEYGAADVRELIVRADHADMRLAQIKELVIGARSGLVSADNALTGIWFVIKQGEE